MKKESGRPNILFLMCDQFRADCIHALGNAEIRTPNIDRLVERGVTFRNAYSTCPVCIPARYTLRTGCEPYNTGYYENGMPALAEDQEKDIHARCGEYLATEMRALGYDTFGIGKFHTFPEFKEDCGYNLQMNTEELWFKPEDREQDAYHKFIRKHHPEYNHIEQLHGERTNMYYYPQMSPLPADLTVENCVAEWAVSEIERRHDRPYFGFVSFIGPHPPCAPPVPYNRMYDPDRMPDPILSGRDEDLKDEQLRFMNHLIWADGLNSNDARNVRSRYYGEITYIDSCIGKILDVVEQSGEADNTMICFFSDHGDHMGDHHSWQKESYYEQSAKVPFLISWPEKWKKQTSDQLVCLTDLFGIATGAAGSMQLRDGFPVLDVLNRKHEPRRNLFACYGKPGSITFKCMLREGDWKYIFFSNGGGQQLFNLKDDPHELWDLSDADPERSGKFRGEVTEICRTHSGLGKALDKNGALRVLPYTERSAKRIHQFDESAGIHDFMCPGQGRT